MKYLFTFLAVIMLMTNPAPAIDPGYATGTLKADGKTFQLKYANVIQYNNEEGFLDKAELRLLLTDKDVPLELLSGPTLDPLQALARKDNMHGILLKIEQLVPLKAKVTTAYGTLLYPPKDHRASLSFFTISDSNGVFDKLVYSNNRVGGKIRYKFKADQTPAFEFDVSFSAPFFQDAVTAKLTGKQALDSPQVKAFLAYQQALKRGDFEAARKLSSPERFEMLDAYIKQAGKAAVLEMIKSEPGLEKIKKQIRSVVVRGSRAFIVLKDKTGRSAQRVLRYGKDWKVD